VISLIVLFLPLLLYKYVPFILSLIPLVDEQAYTNIFLLPIGISFYTFQAVGYVIDVYKNSYKAERNLLYFACFISFFPQLVAGPIERYDNLFEQLRKMKKPTYSDVSSGFKCIILGLCLKLLVAETMANFVNPIYNNLEGKSGFAVIVATQSALGDKPIYVDAPWYVRNYLNKKYKKAVGAIKKVPRKNEYGVNVQELLDFMRGGAKEIVGPNFNFGDIYHAYYA
jgi:D-alanyl-lipoteichoic acid acyltransferase DltB (MBOAT superfamily)